MSTEELKFSDIVQPLSSASVSEPSADLWSRIATAHMVRRSRRRQRKFLGGSVAALAGFAAIFFALQTPNAADTDWQARAQALEIQLHVQSEHMRLENAQSEQAQSEIAANNPVALDAESELARLDSALQAAYDRGAQKSELVPLWKQRSKLLTTLLDARRQTATVTLI
jgi:hypothetical protein